MARLIDGISAAWKKFLGKAATVLSAGANIVFIAVLAMSGGDKDLAQNRLDDAEQRILAGDSTMIITAVRDSTGKTIDRDTLVRPVQEADLSTGMFRLKDTTANGYTMYIATIESIDLLTGKDSVHYILASIPPIGTQWNFKIRQGGSEMASNSEIAKELEQLVAKPGGDTLTEKTGWYPILNANDARMGWSKVKGEKYVEPKVEPVAEEVEAVK